MKVWNESERENSVAIMSRAFAAQHQIAAAILHHKGQNTYLSERRGMHFGVQKMFVADSCGEGVVLVDLAPQSVKDRNIGRFFKEQNLMA